MSAPVITHYEVVCAWASRLPSIEGQSLLETIAQIQRATDFARNAPATLDGRARSLVITKLEEAEHWALHCLRLAVIRELAEKGPLT